MFFFYKEKIPHLFFIIQGIFVVFFAVIRFNTYVEGDGFEYVLMTESFFRHGSADLRMSDAESFRNAWKKEEWDTSFKKKAFEQTYLSPENFAQKEPLSSFGGYFLSVGGKWLCYHFWGYSLSVVPFRWLTKMLGVNPLWAFSMANTFFLLMFLWVVWFASERGFFFRMAYALVCLFPCAYWYISWEHSEIYMLSLVASALLLFDEKKYFLSFVFLMLATWQNQSLIFLPAALACHVFFSEKKKTTFRVFVSFAFVALSLYPSFYYLMHFGQISLIAYSGHLSKEMIHWGRYWGFFFDWNQGMVLGAPLVLLIFPLALVYRISESIRIRRIAYDLLAAGSLLIMVSVFIQMKNWSPGESVVHRYAVWTLPIALVLCGNLYTALSLHLKLLKKNTIKAGVVALILCLQSFSYVLHRKTERYDWCGGQMMPAASWFLKNAPGWYNPDPVIFSMRTVQNYGKDFPLLLYSDRKRVYKAMLLKDSLHLLEIAGLKKEHLSLLKNKKDVFGWIYLPDFILKDTLMEKKLRSIYVQWRLRSMLGKILENNDWMESIRKRSEMYRIPADSLMKADAMYIINTEEQ